MERKLECSSRNVLTKKGHKHHGTLSGAHYVTIERRIGGMTWDQVWKWFSLLVG